MQPIEKLSEKGLKRVKSEDSTSPRNVKKARTERAKKYPSPALLGSDWFAGNERIDIPAASHPEAHLSLLSAISEKLLRALF